MQKSLVLKRLFDLTFATTAVAILLPVFMMVAVLVTFFMGWPPIFVHTRPGFRTKYFNMYKFRTMTNAKNADGTLLPDEMRLNRFGRWLRSTSLDELPELLNVIKGDMSLVGPRPLLVEYLPLYNKEQARRHDVKPGITGWAQIHGRNAISWEKKFELDVWYVTHRTLWLDIKILVRTVMYALKREGIDEPGEVTSSMFMGSGRN